MSSPLQSVWWGYGVRSYSAADPGLHSSFLNFILFDLPSLGSLRLALLEDRE